MSKIMQNLVVFMEPSEDAYDTPVKAGNMILNRFCIDEDAAFELSGISSLREMSRDIIYKKTREFELKRKEKGKEYFWYCIHSYDLTLFRYTRLNNQ